MTRDRPSAEARALEDSLSRLIARSWARVGLYAVPSLAAHLMGWRPALERKSRP